MEITCKEIAEVVQKHVSTSGHRVHTIKLADGGRSVRWDGLVIRPLKVKRITERLKELYPDFHVRVAHSPESKWSLTAEEGLRIRLSKHLVSE